MLSESMKIRTSHYIIAGGSLVVALAWNEAIKGGIKRLYPITGEGVRAAFIYAIVLTMILVIVIYVLPDTKDLLPKDTQNHIERMEAMRREKPQEPMSTVIASNPRRYMGQEHSAVLRYAT